MKNELRLGNYVNCIFSENDYSRIAGITEEHPYIDEITYDYLGWEEIEPIELTEEWLINFGFKENTTSWTFIYVPNYCKPVKLIKYHNRLYFNGKCIHEIHQLQNIYFTLTGEELTLKD